MAGLDSASGAARRAVRWAAGTPLEAWRWARRSVEVRRHEVEAPDEVMEVTDLAPELAEGVQPLAQGFGPAFHRTYSARVTGARVTAEQLLGGLERDFAGATPGGISEVDDPQAGRSYAVGDDVLIHLAGPWDAPVRVIATGARRFRFATRAGHMEAGEIEFSVEPVEGMPTTLDLRIESWARAGDRAFAALYHPLGIGKAVQLHMWITVLERLAERSGGRLVDGIDVTSRWRAVTPDDVDGD